LITLADLDASSFRLYFDQDRWDERQDHPVRTIERIRLLYDVGPVTYPAYPDTSAAMRLGLTNVR
jgi:phage head maturation protease